jgi:hypothetical protein
MNKNTFIDTLQEVDAPFHACSLPTSASMDENRLAVFYNRLSVPLYAPAHINTIYSGRCSALPHVLQR